MKRVLLALILICAILIPFTAYAEDAPPRPILYSYYRQVGWGDRVSIGYVDSNGDIWQLDGYDSNLCWPYKAEEQIPFLSETKFEKAGSLSFDDLFDLRSLVYAVEEQPFWSLPAANDAGTESTYCIHYGQDGIAVPVLLGMSGDDWFENTDPNAQGLYLAARKLFPNVTSYGGTMGPVGFIPVPLPEFCGLGDLSGASVTVFFNDCEAGPRKLDVDENSQHQIVSEMMSAYVTGKVSAIDTTGGFRNYCFYRGDEYLGCISIYNGCLYASDGMYSIASGIG